MTVTVEGADVPGASTSSSSPPGERTPVVIHVASRIEHVTVYARGALVRRSVEVPSELPKGPVELVLEGVSAGAELGSVRCVARGSREVLSVRARLVLPESTAEGGHLAAAVEALTEQRRVLDARRSAVTRRAQSLAQWSPVLRLSRRVERVDPAARAHDTVAASALVSELQGALDAELRSIAREDEALAQKLDAANLALAQGKEREREGARLATLSVHVRLSEGEGALEGLAVEYTSLSARWWPTYTVRVQGKRARWTLEAQVVQRTGEDWQGVQLALSTADLAQDAKLPELPSLRLGRAQPAAKKGYRPAPQGLEALFESYDRVADGGGASGAVTPRVTSAGLLQDLLVRSADVDGIVEEYEEAKAEGGEATADDEPPMGGAPQANMPAPGAAGLRHSQSVMKKSDAPADMPKGGGEIARYRRGAASTEIGAALHSLDEGGAFARFEQQTRAGGGGAAYGGRLSGKAKPADLKPEPPAPDESWTDFDALVLSGFDEHGAGRGKLHHEHAPSALMELRREQRATVESAAMPAYVKDPRISRGRFDHRYDASGSCDVLSDGRTHLVVVSDAEGDASPRFRTVPREAAEVYREAEAVNPFEAPLLAGPVELYVEGTRTSSFALGAVDRGGAVFLSLGVEERLRVARNARVAESTAGLLGGSTVMEHAVSIELSSTLGHGVTVDVIDRVPVTDDKDIEVQLVSSKPRPEVYTQGDRHSPVRGGSRWKVDVPAGGKSAVEFTYRVTFPSKNELVGGNRRE